MTTEDGRRKPRSTVATKVPGIPKVPTKISAELRQYLTSLGEALEIRLGRKGDPRDRAVTLRELTDGGLSGTTIRVGSVTTTGPADDPGGSTAGTPVTPTGLLVTGGFANISLRWNWPGASYSGHSYTEIWRYTSDTLTSATRIGISPGTTFVDFCGGNQTFYYWIRHVNTDGLTGPYNATAGTLGQTQPDVTFLLDLLADSIDTSELVQTLKDDVDLIAALETMIGYSPTYAGSSLLTRIIDSEGDITTITGNLPVDSNGNLIPVPSAASFNSLSADVSTNTTDIAGNVIDIAANATNISAVTAVLPTDAQGNLISAASASGLNALSATVTSQGNSITANSNAITAVEATLPTDANGNIVDSASATALTSLTTTVSNQGGDISANSLAISNVQTTVGQNTTAITTAQSSINGLKAQYTVKIATNTANGTYVSGFGLAQDATTATPTSSFVVAADRFAVIDPATYSTGLTSSNPSSSYVPFVVQTTQTTLQGETVPAGVYIDTAFINKGRILELVAGSVVADYISATVAMDAPYLFGGTINVGQINKPTTDPRTWTVSGNTRVSNFSVDALGVMHANSAVMEGITIKAPDGTVLVDAGGMTGSSGGNLVYNANFRRGDLTFNSATSTWTEDIYLVDGFVEYNPGTGVTTIRKDLGFIRCGDNGTGDPVNNTKVQSYVRSTKQRFPVVAGETLYLYAQTSTTTGLYMAVAFFDHSDGTVTSGYISGAQQAVSVSNGDFDIRSGTGAGGTTKNFAVAAITVPSTTGAHYGEIRFGSNTGDYVYFYNVGVSRTPPEITPQYARTFIRDLSVDTLQIADNAVTVPVTAQYGAMTSYTTDAVETVINTTALAVDFGTNAPNKVIFLAACDVESSALGGDWAAAVLRLKYNTTNTTSLTNAIEVDGVQLNARKGAPPSLHISKSQNGWTGTRYFFLTLEVKAEQGSATGWWRSADANISILGARK